MNLADNHHDDCKINNKNPVIESNAQIDLNISPGCPASVKILFSFCLSLLMAVFMASMAGPSPTLKGRRKESRKMR